MTAAGTAAVPTLAELTEPQRTLATRRWEVLRPHVWDGVPLAVAAREVGVTPRTAQRWLARGPSPRAVWHRTADAGGPTRDSDVTRAKQPGGVIQMAILRAPRARLRHLVAVSLASVCMLSALVACGSTSQPPPGGPSDAVTATLVVPRFNGGSVPTVATAAGWNSFWYNRGFPADQLRLGDTYSPLLAGLRQSSGSGSLVIGASYDWRMPAAPPQGQADGQVTGLLAHWNDPASAATFAYAVDYLRYWLIQAVRSNQGRGVVNVVAHSTGASIVRSYLQSDAYGKSVLAPDGFQGHAPDDRHAAAGSAP